MALSEKIKKSILTYIIFKSKYPESRYSNPIVRSLICPHFLFWLFCLVAVSSELIFIGSD